MAHYRKLASTAMGILLGLTIVGLHGSAAGNTQAHKISATTPPSSDVTADSSHAVTAAVTAAFITVAPPVTTTVQAPVSTTLTTTDTALAREIDDLITTLADKPSGFSGSVLVARNGVPIFDKAFGMASYELDVPNTPQSKYRIASLTKQFVAMAILQLQAQGLLDVHDSICRYVENCPEEWQPITIHHLLNQTSGIADYMDNTDPAFRRTPTSLKKLIETIRDRALRFTPGAQFDYSNSNYIILGSIVEKLAKTNLALYLRTKILDPIGMVDSGLDNNYTILKQRATGYSGSLALADFVEMSVMSAAGGMYSTTEDLLRWDQALYTDKLLPKKLRELMFTPQTDQFSPDDPAKTRYGYGWFIDEAFGRRRIGHGGDIDGFKSEFDRFPDDKVTVIVLSNRFDTDPLGIAESIQKLIFADE